MNTSQNPMNYKKSPNKELKLPRSMCKISILDVCGIFILRMSAQFILES